MAQIEQIASELFNKIRSRFSGVILGDDNAERTLDPSNAKFFEFEYSHGNRKLGNVTITLIEVGILKIFFNNSMIDDMDSESREDWYDFLKDLSRFARRNLLNYEAKNINVSRLDKKNFLYLKTKNAPSDDEIQFESKLYGSKQKSYQDVNGAKLIVHHIGTVDEDKFAARSRNIEKIFIENSEGERFKFPKNYLSGARAMAQHIARGGYPNDERGSHIADIMSEMIELRNFVRKSKNSSTLSEDAVKLIETAKDRYRTLRKSLTTISGVRGYNKYFENNSVTALDENSGSLPTRKITNLKENVQPNGRMALEKIANDNSPFTIYANPESDAEIKDVIEFTKMTDMRRERKIRTIIDHVLNLLSDRMTDDTLSLEISKLDIDVKSDILIASKLANKYLKGMVKIVRPTAHKDRNGNDKKETTMESSSALRGGIWAYPDSMDSVNELQELINQDIELGRDAENATMALYDLIGDDGLFDELYTAANMPGGETEKLNPILKDWLSTNIDNFQDLPGNVRNALENLDYSAETSDSLDNEDEEPDTDANTSDDADDNDELDISVDSDGKSKIEEDIADSVSDSSSDLAAMKRLAGIGTQYRSNHAINPGEEGYMPTPRSIIARARMAMKK